MEGRARSARVVALRDIEEGEEIFEPLAALVWKELAPAPRTPHASGICIFPLRLGEVLMTEGALQLVMQTPS